MAFVRGSASYIPSQSLGAQSGDRWEAEDRCDGDHPSMLQLKTLHGCEGNIQSAAAVQRGWGPYVNNGGTVIAVSGDDYAIIVGDTRLSVGYSIHTRNFSKVTQLTAKCAIASSGMQSDIMRLHRVLKFQAQMYEHQHRAPPSVIAISQLLSTLLYYKRFFPYYTFNVLSGIDDEGKGAVYGYDAVGSFDRGPYFASGTGGSLILSILDNQLLKTNQQLCSPKLSKVQVIDLVKDIITSAGERDIFTGDKAEVVVIDKAGITRSILELRKD